MQIRDGVVRRHVDTVVATMTAAPQMSPTARLVGVVVRVARQDEETAGCGWPSQRSAGGPLLGPLELVEAEQGELAGDHPGEGVQRVGDPVLVGHDRNSLERRMMLDQGAQAQLQVRDQAADISLISGHAEASSPTPG